MLRRKRTNHNCEQHKKKNGPAIPRVGPANDGGLGAKARGEGPSD